MVASYNGHVDVINVLLQHGASVNLPKKVKFCIGTSRSFVTFSTYGNLVWGAHLSVENFPLKHHLY